MKYLIALPLAALALTVSANAQTTTTNTIEKPKGSATRTVTRDDGNLSVDGTVTRASDGATATWERDRIRTEDGVSGSGSSTGFNGQTRSYEYDRTRTGDGFTTTGSATDRQGRTYEYDAYGRKTETGRENSRTVTRDGEQVYNRTGNVSRVDGQVQRDVSVTRAQDFRPKKARAARPGKSLKRARGN